MQHVKRKVRRAVRNYKQDGELRLGKSMHIWLFVVFVLTARQSGYKRMRPRWIAAYKCFRVALLLNG